MTKEQHLIKEIAKLQAKYDKSTGREAYKLGAKLRAKQNELKTLQS